VALLDPYERRARLAVTYLIFSPAIVLVICLALGTNAWWSKLGGVLVACGAPGFAAQWGRSGGKRKEAELFARWGGAPTTQVLRFTSGDPEVVVERRHETVTRATGVKLPTADEEARDPQRADGIYANATATLRELTRDRNAFPLVFAEVVNYGFRRNLWGRKPFGLAVASVALCIALGFLVASILGHQRNQLLPATVAVGFASIALASWLLIITPNWVEETADAYAQRLVESAVVLPPHE
jgi:hypothetical protein